MDALFGAVVKQQASLEKKGSGRPGEGFPPSPVGAREVWRWVPGSRRLVKASNLGRIKTVPRRVHSRRKMDSKTRIFDVPGRIKKPWLRPDGYRVVEFSRRMGFRARISGYVCVLVCSAFHGVKPSRDHQVNHKNGIKTDDHATNLEWVTPRENSEHAARMGLLPTKVTPEEARKAIQDSRGDKHLIARRLGVHFTLIYRLLKRQGEQWDVVRKLYRREAAARD